MKKTLFSKAVSILLAALMLLSIVPMSALAAPATDLPENMKDHAILRALAYTGYNVQKQKDDGTLYQTNSFGSRTPSVEYLLRNSDVGQGNRGRRLNRYGEKAGYCVV